MIKNIEKLAEDNTYFRHVLETGEHTQVVVMSIPVGGEIGEETHSDNDQVLLCVKGVGKVILEGIEGIFEEDDLVLVKSGTKHNFINTGDKDMKVITTYAPPHHPEGTIHKTKRDADQEEY